MVDTSLLYGVKYFARNSDNNNLTGIFQSRFIYDMPTNGNPGKWHILDTKKSRKAIKCCQYGFHVPFSIEGSNHWGSEWYAAYLVQLGGFVDICEDKVAVQYLRLVTEMPDDFYNNYEKYIEELSHYYNLVDDTKILQLPTDKYGRRLFPVNF